MKTLPPALSAHLATGVTTLAWCWKIRRRDGATLGFTDHDRDLSFAGTTYESSTGFTASEITDSVGLAVDNLEVDAAITSANLAEGDLADGLYDDAEVEIWRVNWSDTTQRVLVRKGSLGEVRRAGRAFSAEIRGLAHYLGQPKGRLFQYGCDATFTDARCGVSSADPRYRATATILSGSNQRALIVSGLAAFAPDWFTGGLLTVTSGPLAGRSSEIRRHGIDDAAAIIELWQPLADAPTSGTTLAVLAGCDKTFPTCRDRFANAANYRGFPHMPGNDFIARVARSGDPSNDGSARVS